MTQLYKNFQPQHYDLYLDINRQKKRFSGTTQIEGHANRREITINQKNLTIKSVQQGTRQLPFTSDNQTETLKITLPTAGRVAFKINYVAKLTDNMMGIYPSYYQDHGQTKQIIGTQFESTAARQAFPCVDEPQAKATFSLAVKFDEHPGETVLSNMPEDHQKDGVHYFQQTVRMSTYLVAFAFGDLTSVKTQTNDGVDIGVFAAASHPKRELTFALDIAKRSIEFYENFYHTKYPLPHSWELALPDFSAGAMENWGLVTYRESLLLLDPRNASFSKKQLVAKVIAHELAHQWFGDLVTMKWWNDLWLNESFANMMEYVAVDALEPTWHIWDTFQTAEVPIALQRDAIDGVQPVHVQVNNPGEIDSLFDPAIVYAKGARMLVMVRALLGDRALRDGLKHYLAAHKYGNAQGSDLWQALSQASGMDVGSIMNSWLEQPGYPIVTAKVVDGDLKLTQHQFFIGQGHDRHRLWQIPLNSNYAAVPKVMKKATLDLGNYQQLRQQAARPFRLNIGNNAHFIVEYDHQLLSDIMKHLDQMDAVDHFQFLQNLHLLARSGQISYAKLVPLLPKFANDHSAMVNEEIYQIVHDLKKFVNSKTDRQNFCRFLNQLSQSQFQRLGIAAQETDSDDDRLIRPLILKAAVMAGNPRAVKASHQWFVKNRAQLNTLPAAIRGVIIANEVRNYGQSPLFQQLLTDYGQSQDAGYKADLCGALTGARDVDFIKCLIRKFKDTRLIKPQDLRTWFAGLLANRKGQALTWSWLRHNWSWLEKTVGGDMEFTFYITIMANIFHTAQRLTEFKQFFEPKLKVAGLTREIQMDTKIIRGWVKLTQKNRQPVNQAIQKIVSD